MKHQWVGLFIITFPAKLEQQVDEIKTFLAQPIKRFKQGAGVEEVSAGTLIKFKISNVTESEANQVQAQASRQAVGSWFHLKVSAKALTRSGQCKCGLQKALKDAGFLYPKIDFQVSTFKSKFEIRHSPCEDQACPRGFRCQHATGILDPNRSQCNFDYHKAVISRIPPELSRKKKLKPGCFHPLAFSCLFHIISDRKQIHKGRPAPGKPQIDFLAAQLALQNQEPEE